METTSAVPSGGQAGLEAGRVPETLLSIGGLSLSFATESGRLPALEDVSLRVHAGEAVCLVGESGSGKSVTALSVARLLSSPPACYTAGRIWLRGEDVLRASPAALRRLRGGVVSYVFQDPGASLNPVFPVGRQILESLRLHRREAATEEEVIRLLRLMGIPAPESRMRDYPHQMSGGMQQRVMMAMALAPQPALLVADEPTTALDVTIQAQIMELLADLRVRLGMSLLLITHNLGLVGDWADRMVVMYAGQVVEEGPAREVLRNPAHPYTRALLESVPQLGADQHRLRAIGGAPPTLGAFPAGCRFHPRCRLARESCRSHPPALETLGSDRRVRCPFQEDVTG